MTGKLLSALTALLLLSVPASADLILTLNPTGIGPYDTGLESPPGGYYQPALCQNSDGSGSCVLFTGTITTGGDETQDYFLDALYVTMNPSNPDDGAYVFDNTYQSDWYGNAFFLNAISATGLLGPDSPAADPYTYTGGIFEVDVEPGAPLGDYFGTAALEYTDQTGCQDPENPCTVSADFEVVVAPEPAVFILVATGLAALAILRRRHGANAE